MKHLPLTDVTEHTTCVERVPIFAGLAKEDQLRVAALARPLELEAGEVLAHAGERVTRLFVVHTGAVKLTHTSASGRSRLVRVAEDGESLGEQWFLTGELPAHTMEAATLTRLCAFEHTDLERLLARYPAVSAGIMRALALRLADAERRLALGGVDVSVRVAAYLLDLPTSRRAGEVVVELPWPKKDIASWLAATPESFSRALSRLSRSEVIQVDGVTVTLRDLDALDELASN